MICKRGNLPGALHGPFSETVVACVSDQAGRQVGSSWDSALLKGIQKLCSPMDTYQDSGICQREDGLCSSYRGRHNERKHVVPCSNSSKGVHRSFRPPTGTRLLSESLLTGAQPVCKALSIRMDSRGEEACAT